MGIHFDLPVLLDYKKHQQSLYNELTRMRFLAKTLCEYFTEENVNCILDGSSLGSFSANVHFQKSYYC